MDSLRLTQTLTEIKALNNQAAQDLASHRYMSAVDNFSAALHRSKIELAQSDGLPQTGGVTTSVDIGIAWNEISFQEQEERYLHDMLVFQQPLLLRIHHHTHGHEDEIPRDNHGTTDELFQTICFGMIVNLAVCYHKQALFEQKRRASSQRCFLLLEKASQLYRLAGDLIPAVEGRQAPLRLILLNNMGETFLQLGSLGDAIQCFQALSSALESLKNSQNGHGYYPTSTSPHQLNCVDDDMKKLIQHFHSCQRNSRISTTISSCAPAA